MPNEELTLTMRDWRVYTPKEFSIGFQGENDTRSLVIDVDNAEDYEFKLDVCVKDGRNTVKNIVDLNKNGNTLSVTLKKEMLANSGMHRMQIRGIRGDEIRKSNIFHVNVFQSINATDAFSESIPSEFEQIERRVTQLKTDAEQAAEEAREANEGIQVWVGDNPPTDGSKLLQLLDVENPGDYLAVSRGEFNEAIAQIRNLIASSVVPTVSAADNGKTLMVVDGAWCAVRLSDSEAAPQ